MFKTKTMIHLFYFFTIILIWKELIWILSPNEKVEESKKYFNLSKEFKGKTWNEYSKEYKELTKSKIWLLFLFLWLFIGLFTNQWVAFLSFLLLNFIIVAPLSKITKFSKSYVYLHWINSVIGFCFGIFVIINHYHLKINLTELLFNLF